MSIFSRLLNVFGCSRLHHDIAEELNSHLDEAIESGLDPIEARRSFGSVLRYREQSRDAKVVVCMDSLRADVIFGWRQIRKKPAISIAIVLSLGLAMGSCTAVFRLIDALLLRPLPVSHADRLYAMVLRGIGPDGTSRDSDSNEYPQFLKMRSAVRDDAELIAASWAERTDLTFRSDSETEKAYRQYVSAWMFDQLALNQRLDVCCARVMI